MNFGGLCMKTKAASWICKMLETLKFLYKKTA